MPKLFLLDAYALIYRAYYGLIKNPRINSRGENTSAIFGFVRTLDEVLGKERPTHIGVAFDPKGGTFRHERYPEYKAQREQTPEAIRFGVPVIKKLLAAYRIPILEVAGYEADDVIGTLAHQADAKGIETYMMTPDKDYGQLVTDHVRMFRPRTMGPGFEVLGRDEVCKKWNIERASQVIDMLGLMGDSSDNIPGCPGVGEKTAATLIRQFGSIDNMLQHTDELKGAIQRKVVEGADQIRLSRWLAEIVLDVPIQLDMDALAIREPDVDALNAIFTDLEMRSLLRKTDKAAAVAQVQPVSQDDPQLDLFASVPELEPAPEPKSNTIDNDEERRHLLNDVLLKAQEVGMITHRTGDSPIDSRLKAIDFAVNDSDTYHVVLPEDDAAAKQVVDELRPLLESASIRKVGYGMKHDINVLANYGVKLQGELWDTEIAQYVLQPDMRRPNTTEANTALRQKRQQQAQLEAEGSLTLFTDIEMPLMPVLAAMERSGVCIDTAALHQASETLTAQMEQVAEEIHKVSGADFNISSPKQIGELLFDKLHLLAKPKKTKTGQYVTSEDVLESLRDKHPVVQQILTYRAKKKLISTYLDALPGLINPRSGRIHTSFNQTVTATGRLSSSNPNLQNIPVRTADGREIRRAFIPEPGQLFFSADYSQIELRIMAHLSGDESLIDDFVQGHDIHAATAAKIFHKQIDEVTREERGRAKTANFGIIYGITTFGLAERLGIPRSEAKELIENYFKTYPRVQAYMQESIERARQLGYTETLLHRRCYLRDINSANSVVRGYAERNAINAPIQGSAADIIKVAMARIYNRFCQEGLQSRMILQVHDELNFSVLPEEREVVEQIVINEMQSAYQMTVPLIADCGWGSNWLEAH